MSDQLSAIEHIDDWRKHYPTERAYGQKIPTPEDWVFSDYERGGEVLAWGRFDEIGHDHTADHGVVEARDNSMNAGTPDEEAILSPEAESKPVEIGGEYEFRPVANPADRELTIDGNTIFRAHDPIDENKLLAGTAAILTRYSQGEDYEEIVRELEAVDTDNSETLERWNE